MRLVTYPNTRESEDNQPHRVSHMECESCGEEWMAVVIATHDGPLGCPVCAAACEQPDLIGCPDCEMPPGEPCVCGRH